MRDPDWLRILKEECSKTTQREAAGRIGCSQTVVNQVVNGRYRGSLANVEARVRGELMGRTVDCPILGELSLRKCEDHKRRPFAMTNPTRILLFRTCPTCKHGGGR